MCGDVYKKLSMKLEADFFFNLKKEPGQTKSTHLFIHVLLFLSFCTVCVRAHIATVNNDVSLQSE